MNRRELMQLLQEMEDDPSIRPLLEAYTYKPYAFMVAELRCENCLTEFNEEMTIRQLIGRLEKHVKECPSR